MLLEYEHIDYEIDEQELEKALEDLDLIELIKDYFKDKAYEVYRDSEDYKRMVKNLGR